MMTFVGLEIAAQRNIIIADLLPEGLAGLLHMTEKEMRDTYTSYTKRTDRNYPVFLTPIQKQRLKSLMIWVQDMERVQ